MNGYKIVLLKAIFMLYRLPESERVCSGICKHLFEVYQNIENIIHIILFLLKKKIYCVKGHLDELYED